MKVLENNTRILTVEVYTTMGNLVDTFHFDITDDEEVQWAFNHSEKELKNHIKKWFENSCFYSMLANTDIYEYDYVCKLFR